MEHFAVSPIASLSLWTDGLAKCRRNENGAPPFGTLREVLINGEGDSEEETRAEQVVSADASKLHCLPKDWQRKHGDPRSQAAFAEKHA
jgi:hypothetical protein